jgi:23S rRNA maturation-related 3'-5' exoribonuclease YhaM
MTPAREKFNKAMEFISRDGLQDFIKWLENETDFFTAPSSTAFHGNFIEGLLQHSVNVLEFAIHNFNILVKKKPEYEHLRESLIISAIFHDVCKTNQYKITEKVRSIIYRKVAAEKKYFN